MERLSSSFTFAFKFIFTAGWTLLFGLGTVLRFVHRDPEVRATGWVFAAAWLGGSALLWLACAGLKRVDLDGTTLVISNFRTEVRVPVGEVTRVYQNMILSVRPITLTFKHPTPFGRSIVFLPPTSFRLLSEDEIVARLRSMARTSTPTEARA